MFLFSSGLLNIFLLKMQGGSFFLFLLLICEQSAQGQEQQLVRSPIGSGCVSSFSCVSNAECVSNVCQCKTGFTLLSSLECRMDFDGQCSKNEDCNMAMGLRCLSSTCRCPSGDEYIFELGMCMNTSMKLMYQDVSGLINQTTFELKRFTTLFSIFMIQSNQGTDNSLISSASEISPVVYQRLEALEQQLLAEQNPIPSIVLPNIPQSAPGPPQINNGATPSTPFTRAQVEAPQTINPFESLLSNITDTINNIQIVPTTQAPPNSIDELFPDPTSAPNPTSRPQQGPGNALASIIPSFIGSFAQFLPLLQRFNNVLTTAIVSPFRLLQRAQVQQAQQPAAPVNPNPSLGNLGNLGIGNVNLSGLLSVPLRLLQIPGRIFTSLFGSSIDFNNRPIPFLPWPFG